jgi:hypothetical protein
LKTKLSLYTEFAYTLLPQEGQLILNQFHFKDPQNIDILKKTALCATRSEQFTGFDASVDKRKYAYLKSWISKKLLMMDVDAQYDWIAETERQVMHDNIEPEREKQLNDLLQRSQSSDYFFLKLYELAIYYHHFAQVRMKEQASETVNSFIQKNAEAYSLSRESLNKMTELTQEITDYYLGKSKLRVEGEAMLSDIFHHEHLPGMIRYYALVRLTFLYYIQNRLEQVLPYYEQMDKMFLFGSFYSKRILSNYYSNLLIINSKLGRLEEAERFGRFSILYRNNDFLHYINNLAAVQLRQQKPIDALETLRLGVKDARSTDNFHNKQSFTALFVRALSETGQLKAAEKYGEAFIESHRKDMLKARWHIFFTSYFQTLWSLERYKRMITLTKSFDLVELEEQQKEDSRYTPLLSIYYYLAMYQEGKISSEELSTQLQQIDKELKSHPERQISLEKLQKQIKVNLEAIVEKHRSDYLFL